MTTAAIEAPTEVTYHARGFRSNVGNSAVCAIIRFYKVDAMTGYPYAIELWIDGDRSDYCFYETIGEARRAWKRTEDALWRRQCLIPAWNQKSWDGRKVPVR